RGKSAKRRVVSVANPLGPRLEIRSSSRRSGERTYHRAFRRAGGPEQRLGFAADEQVGTGEGRQQQGGAQGRQAAGDAAVAVGIGRALGVGAVVLLVIVMLV